MSQQQQQSQELVIHQEQQPELQRKPKRRPKGNTKKHTLQRQSFLRILTFGWLNEFIWVSQANPWTQDMNYDLPPYDRVQKNKKRLLSAFKRTKNSQSSIVLAYLPELFTYLTANILFTILNSLAQKRTSEVGALINDGTLYQDQEAVLTFSWLLVQSIGYLYIAKIVICVFSFMLQRAAVSGRTGMYSVLQDKIMSFSQMNSREIGEGFITNLIQVDAMNVDKYYYQVNMGLSLSVNTGVSLYFMVTAIEWELSLGYVLAVIGIRVFFLLIFAGITYYQSRYLRAKDRRMDLLKNVLENVDFIKINRLEAFFCLELFERRETELMELRSIAFVSSAFEFFKRALIKAPSLVIIVLILYVIPTSSSSKMSFENYLFFLQLGNTLNGSISAFFDTAKGFITARVSMKRIDRFLLARERDVAGAGSGYRKVHEEGSLVAVEVSDGCFQWMFGDGGDQELGGIGKGKGRVRNKKNTKRRRRTKRNGSKKNKNKIQPKRNGELEERLLIYKNKKNLVNQDNGGEEIVGNKPTETESETEVVTDEAEFYLTDVNLKIMKGETVVVLGKNCSGRSSFLYSLMGEMIPATQESSVTVNGSMAFLSQARWLLGMSVKENILLGKEYNEERMNEALRCSQLEKDLKNLLDGLNTSIGDNGDTISGGQRARIALARCFYQE